MRQIAKTFNSSKHESKNTGEKDLITRVMGRFYTHEIIGRQLACGTLKAAQSKDVSVLRIIDPFCGDGRLVCWLLEEMLSSCFYLHNTLDVELWDCDEVAVNHAEASVTQFGVKLGLKLHVNVRVVDTFEYAFNYLKKFDIVITNPPWEIIKPDSRELQKLTSKEIEEYRLWLKEKDLRLAELYPLSQPKQKRSGWGTNLARCGTEVALRLTAAQGICGLVSPVSLLADQMTEKLRHWILREHIIHELAYYPAEARLFEKVDQASITLVASPGQSEYFSPHLCVYNRERQVQTRTVFSLSWEEMEANNLTVPIHFGESQLQIFNKWSHFSTFGELEGSENNALWAGRELDETGHKKYLEQDGDYLFLKGKMIQRFKVVEQPWQFVKRDKLRIPSSTAYHRIAWRDVSRPSQKRRLQATLIPPGWITGNSLHVAYFRDSNLERLKALLAIMNSLVFEFQLRAYLATSHVSLSSVRKVRIPLLNNNHLVTKLSNLAGKSLNGCEASHIEIEREVAKAYNLAHDEFKLLLSAFDKLTDVELNALLQPFT